MPTTLPERRSQAFLCDDFPFSRFFLIAVLGSAAQLWLGVPNEPWMLLEAGAESLSVMCLLGP